MGYAKFYWKCLLCALQFETIRSPPIPYLTQPQYIEHYCNRDDQDNHDSEGTEYFGPVGKGELLGWEYDDS